MLSKLGLHLYRNGLFTGWTEYREGPEVVERFEPIYSDGRREQLSVRVVELLEEWRSSPFENEGAIRYQLRHSLCLQGYGWGRSDAEAAAVIALAYKALRIERPTLEEAQRSAPNEEFYCNWCNSPIDDETRTRKQRFCTVECAKMAMIHRARDDGNYIGVTLRSAKRMIEREKAPPKPCKHCDRPFQSDRETALYCSTACTTAGVFGDRLLPDIVCEGCGETTKPATRGSRFCSHSCSAKVQEQMRREKLADVFRECQECTRGYQPRSDRDRFCSPRCGSRARNREYRARGGAPARFVYSCKACGIGFESRKPKVNSQFCGEPCRQTALRYESGAAKKLSSRLFDYMLHRDRVPMTGNAITDRLFEAA